MQIRHSENADFLSVIMDEPPVITDGGIILTEAEAAKEVESSRTATVHAAPEFYTYERAKGPTKVKHIRTESPVKAGDRILLNRYAGVKHIQAGDLVVSIVRFNDILGVVEDE